MSIPSRHPRPGRRGAVFAALFVLAFAAPTAAQAAPVNLATASPFVVLGGQAVTNTDSSVLNGDLGVSPVTSITGLGFPTVVNGATHENDAVAAGAQLDLTNAYNVAAGQPFAADLSGTDLGNRILTPGAYRYTEAALLTGPLTLDAEGDPDAQFVFQIGSALTAESASSVNLINGASPCNVYWQVGTSATLGTTTRFVGNVLAQASISLNRSATVEGRLLARNGAVTLIENVLIAPLCAPDTTTGPTAPTGSTPPATTPSAPAPTTGQPTAKGKANGNGNGNGKTKGNGKSGTKGHNNPVSDRKNGTAVVRRAPHNGCTSGFSATVRGHMIKRVAFSLDGQAIGSRGHSPYRISVRATPGAHRVGARVTFKDATPAKTMTLPYRACAAAVLHPHSGPSQFTG